jgi:hypothetical protein
MDTDLQGTVQLKLEEGIDRDSLMEVLDRVLELHGCSSCGLAGLDLEIRSQPRLQEKFGDLGGVIDVSLANR